jgi:hypothetical protein
VAGEQGGKMSNKLEFDAATHTYTLGGVRLPSVTAIIGHVLPYDFGPGVWHMDRGTKTHLACKFLDA